MNTCAIFIAIAVATQVAFVCGQSAMESYLMMSMLNQGSGSGSSSAIPAGVASMLAGAGGSSGSASGSIPPAALAAMAGSGSGGSSGSGGMSRAQLMNMMRSGSSGSSSAANMFGGMRGMGRMAGLGMVTGNNMAEMMEMQFCMNAYRKMMRQGMTMQNMLAINFCNDRRA